MTVETPDRHVIAIQMLRGIAASMVMFVHLDTELDRLHFARLGSDWLATGVDIFFVISGFIMWTSVERRGHISATAFLRNRLIRIVPLYWVATSALVLVAFITPQLLRTTSLQPIHTIASYLFIPARHPTTHNFWPVLVPGWSLNYEMLFYVVFALGIALSANRRSVRFALIVLMILAVLGISRTVENRIDTAHFYANPIMLEFLIGMALGWACLGGWVRSTYAFLPVVMTGFVILWPGAHAYSYLPAAYIGATMIVGGAVFLPQIAPNPLSRLGDASYSLYLTHAMSLAAFAAFCEHLDIKLPMTAFIVVSLAFALAVAFLVYRFFELPVTAWLKKPSPGKALRLDSARPQGPQASADHANATSENLIS